MNAEPSRKSTRAKAAIVLVMVGIYFFSYFQRIAIPGTIFNKLQSDFAASASAIAMLGAIVFYLYAGMQVLTGLLADRFGAGRIIVLGGTIMAAGSLLFPLSHSLSLLYLTRSLVGLGASLIFVSMTKEIDELFGERAFAMVLGLAVFLGYTGALVGTYPLERAVEAIGWRKSLLAAGAMSALAVLAVACLLGKTGRLHTGDRDFSWGRIRAVLTNRTAIPLLFAGSVSAALYLLLQATIGKKLLQDCYGFSSASAAACTFAMVLVHMMGSALSGFVSRLLNSRRKPLLVAATLLSVAWTSMLLMILQGVIPPTLLLVSYVLSSLSGCVSPVFLSAMKETNPSDTAGTSVGLLNGACYLVAAIVMNVSGRILDVFKGGAKVTETAVLYPTQAYAAIVTGAVALAVLAFISSFFIKESHGRCIYPDDRGPWGEVL